MNNYFINITKNLDLKPSTVPNTNDLDKITKHFDDHISICKEKIILVLKWFPWTKSRKKF